MPCRISVPVAKQLLIVQNPSLALMHTGSQRCLQKAPESYSAEDTEAQRG
jgi:hypothetical protein